MIIQKKKRKLKSSTYISIIVFSGEHFLTKLDIAYIYSNSKPIFIHFLIWNVESETEFITGITVNNNNILYGE